MTKITNFFGANRFLSNFYYPCNIELDGDIYPSTEHAYQAAKTFDIGERMSILEAKTPGEAKRLGKKVTLREDWDKVKLSVMEDLLRQKFTKVALRARLLLTGEAELIEGNTWGDTFWGVCGGVGENHLGKILMKIRNELL